MQVPAQGDAAVQALPFGRVAPASIEPEQVPWLHIEPPLHI